MNCFFSSAHIEDHQTQKAKEPVETKLDSNVKTCSCDYVKKPMGSNKNIKKEAEEEDKINFENALQNVVYIKKT